RARFPPVSGKLSPRLTHTGVVAWGSAPLNPGSTSPTAIDPAFLLLCEGESSLLPGSNPTSTSRALGDWARSAGASRGKSAWFAPRRRQRNSGRAGTTAGLRAGVPRGERGREAGARGARRRGVRSAAGVGVGEAGPRYR